jgi:putative effector of murein hydrolase LrgA (UPF0299 family)
MSRPLSITIIAILFLCLGLKAVYEIIERAMQGSLHINLGFFMIPIAIGLLRGKDSSRIWAKIWCGFSILVAVVLALAYPFYGYSWNIIDSYGWVQALGRQTVVVLGVLIILLPAMVVWRCLSTERARGFFAN